MFKQSSAKLVEIIFVNVRQQRCNHRKPQKHYNIVLK